MWEGINVGRNRYRGGRERGKGPILGVLAAFVLLAAGGLLAPHLLRVKPPEPAPVVAAAVVPAPSPTPEPTPTPLPTPGEVRGIYISGPVAGDPYMDKLLDLLDSTELNAVVIDVKNDEGQLTYKPDSGTALELGACVRYIGDLPGLLERLKEHGIYTIARVAAFKDPVLAEARPELALRRVDGANVAENNGPAWVNPYAPEVRDYLLEVALGAAEAGFDEVQFDYVRFPAVKDIDDLDYGSAADGVSREDAVVSFLEYVRSALHEKGVRVSADVFGTVITSQVDAALIGQDYTRMGAAVDYLCPMVYPSHYAAGAFGLEVPDREPYETVCHAMEASRGDLLDLKPEERAGVRAWLQGFTATWVKGHIDYGGDELRAQIQAIYDAGYTDWILWNAKNTYTADGLLPAE